MKVVEFEAKRVLAAQGLAVPKGRVANSVQHVAEMARQLGLPVVLKAQIPSGGRMKAGGVFFAHTVTEVESAAQNLFGKEICGYQTTQVGVEQKLNIIAEIFAGVTYNTELRSAVVLASKAGGIDIEASSEVIQKPFSVLSPFPDYLGREIAAELGFTGRHQLQLGAIITQLGICFTLWDALLLEINPLVLTDDNRWQIADVHLELDDDAVYRQPELLRQLPQSLKWALQQTDFERHATEIDQASHRGVAGRLVPFEGNLGLLIGGGGASLTTFDAVLNAGLKPANYCEIGGNPSVWKTKELTKLILSQPQVDRLAVIMNVVSNTRVDLVARGVIKGILELGLEPKDVIAVFRIPGSWEDEGQAVLRHYNVPFFGRETSIDQVVEAIK